MNPKYNEGELKFLKEHRKELLDILMRPEYLELSLHINRLLDSLEFTHTDRKKYSLNQITRIMKNFNWAFRPELF